MRIEGTERGLTQFLEENLKKSAERETKSFLEIVEDFLKEVNDEQLKAREVEKALSRGEVRNLEEALLAIEKADLSLRLAVELRNKALESYQEIMRMQV
jgi:flagellar hook-basal body complex protein FliE